MDEIGVARGEVQTIKEESPKASRREVCVGGAMEEGSRRAPSSRFWMADNAASLLNRCGQGQDCEAERHRVRREGALQVTHHWGQLAKLSSMWEDGIFLGVRSVGAEMIDSLSAVLLESGEPGLCCAEPKPSTESQRPHTFPKNSMQGAACRFVDGARRALAAGGEEIGAAG